MEIKEAIGCIGIICGHNSDDGNPLLSFIIHLVAAIAHGNTVVIVPDEKCPTLALDLYEILEASDMPDGVINILSGSKQHLTKYLCEHQQVNAIWYMADFSKQDIENKQISDAELLVQQFIKYTSGHSMKQTWFINSPVQTDENGINKCYLSQLHHNSVQNKYVHIPMGTIFAN